MVRQNVNLGVRCKRVQRVLTGSILAPNTVEGNPLVTARGSLSRHKPENWFCVVHNGESNYLHGVRGRTCMTRALKFGRQLVAVYENILASSARQVCANLSATE